MPFVLYTYKSAKIVTLQAYYLTKINTLRLQCTN